ncbi:MAG: PilZ domain-containing protein [Desulfobacterales bacterium]|nr:PilZ domain-containing protein [Desulfobacterales bacterium]
MDKDKRKTPRIDFYLPVVIKGHKGVRKVKDFSLGGVFIQIEDVSGFKQGDEIELVIELPHEKDAIEVRARIMRVTSNGIGAEFVDLSPQHAMALEFCFHLFKNTVPFPRR